MNQLEIICEDYIQPHLQKVLSNEITAFLFIVSVAIGAALGVASGYIGAYATVVYWSAY